MLFSLFSLKVSAEYNTLLLIFWSKHKKREPVEVEWWAILAQHSMFLRALQYVDESLAPNLKVLLIVRKALSG